MRVGDLREQLDTALSWGAHADFSCLTGPLEPIHSGWASTHLFTTALARGEASPFGVVIKLYGADGAGEEHAAREAIALDMLGANGMSVPSVVLTEPDSSTFGQPVLVMRQILGGSFWSIYEIADHTARARLITAFTEQLVRLHSLDPRLLTVGRSHVDRYRAVDAELEGLDRDLKTPEHAGMAEVVRWLHDGSEAVPCARPVILHRDYHPWNVILDESGRLWVIDWDWRVGDPRFDLAWTCTLMQRSGYDEFSTALSAEYERQTGDEMANIEYFEVLATTRWLMNVLPALGPRSRLQQDKREAFRTFLGDPLQRAHALLVRRTGLCVAPFVET